VDFCKMAVFLWFALVIHFLADFLSHGKKRGSFIFLHCFIYSLFFVPLFWWLGINFLWLILIFSSHLVVDSQQRNLLLFCSKILREKSQRDKIFISYDFIVAGLDHVLHLLTLGVVAFFI
jgi:hypothetical protein